MKNYMKIRRSWSIRNFLCMYGLIWGSTKLNKIKKKAKQRQKVSFCGIV